MKVNEAEKYRQACSRSRRHRGEVSHPTSARLHGGTENKWNLMKLKGITCRKKLRLDFDEFDHCVIINNMQSSARYLKGNKIWQLPRIIHSLPESARHAKPWMQMLEQNPATNWEHYTGVLPPARNKYWSLLETRHFSYWPLLVLLLCDLGAICAGQLCCSCLSGHLNLSFLSFV